MNFIIIYRLLAFFYLILIRVANQHWTICQITYKEIQF